MTELFCAFPLALCGLVVCVALAGAVKLASVLGFKQAEQGFIKWTDEAIKEEQDKIDQRKTAGVVRGAK